MIEEMYENPFPSIFLLVIIFLVWYITYIRLTPLEKKLLTNVEKICRKIINIVLGTLFILSLVFQKAYRMTKEENSSYNIEELFREISTLYIFFASLLIVIFIVVVLLEFSQKKYFYDDNYFVYNEKKYYLIGVHGKNHLSFKVKAEDGDSKDVYRDILKKREFIDDREFFSSSQMPLTNKIKIKYDQLHKAVASLYREERKLSTKVGATTLLIIGICYIIYMLVAMVELFKLFI